MSAINERTYGKLLDLARNNLNVLLTGTHGVGKTTLCRRIQRDLGLQHVKYYSASTLDPWVDLVGVPVPDGESIRFCRPADLRQAEWIIFDEINRSHAKVQNALFELIQFRSINGVPVPDLKMVWAMQNPPGGLYQVTELDPALVDRFHARVTLDASPNPSYYTSACAIDTATAQALVDWWNKDLKDDSKAMVTPRTLEAIGLLIGKGLDWEFALGSNLGVPTSPLVHRLGGCPGLTQYERIDFPTMTLELAKYEQLAQTDADFAVHVVRQAQKSWGTTNYKVAPILLALPAEYLTKLMTDAAWVQKMKANFKDEVASTEAAKTLYAKVCKASGVQVSTPSA
jgi:GTPase SAR1 family protein